MSDQQQQQQQQLPAPHVAQPISFSNDYLLKYDCHDRFSTAQALRKFINKQLPPPKTQLPPSPLFPGLTRIGKNPNNSCVFFNFTDDATRAAAKDLLDTVVYRGKKYHPLQVTEGDLKVGHRGQAKNNNNSNNSGQQRRQRQQGDENGDDEDRGGGDDDEDAGITSNSTNNLAPWLHLPYAEQLNRKAAHCKRVLNVISKYHSEQGGGANNSDGKQLVASLKDGSLFDGVIASPETIGYRNNVQVSAGYSKEGKPIFGFMSGAVVDGNAYTLPVEAGFATQHPAVPVLTKMIEERVVLPAQKMQNFSGSDGGSAGAADDDTDHQKSSFDGAKILGMYNRVTQQGFWRRIQFRFNAKNETMIDVEASDEGVPDEAVKFIKQKLVECFKADGGFYSFPAVAPAAAVAQQQQQQQASSPQTKTGRVTSLQFHIYNGKSVADAGLPREVLLGSPTLTDEFGGLQFELSPTDFFQVNRAAMQLLLDKIKAAATLSPERTTLFDLCSGTGTLGLAFARSVKKVVGIEIVETAVANARQNAVRNGITNAEFICGKVEVELTKVLRGLKPEELQDCVAILDPPRTGVNSVVLKALRNIPGLSTIVYISCDQRSLESNCEPLTKDRTGAFHGAPFQVVGAFGVDLFPNTHHVEMIAIMKREPVAASSARTAAAVAAAASTKNETASINEYMKAALAAAAE